MITVRASMLDDWRMYVAGEMEADALRARLSARRATTPAMEAGTALGAYLASQPVYSPADSILELHDPDDTSIHFAITGDYRFDFAADIEIPALVNPEMHATKRYQLDDGTPVLLSGHVDGFDGFAVDENKLTQQLDAERYVDSYQWRAYLVLFDAQKVNCNIFICKELGVTVPMRNHDAPWGVGDEGEPEVLQHWLVRDFRRFQFYRYAEIENDVRREVLSFARFIKAVSTPCDHADGPVERMRPSVVAGEPPYLEEVCSGCSQPWCESTQSEENR